MSDRYKTFWPRIGALLIDGLVLMPASWALELAHKSGAPAITLLALLLDCVILFGYTIYLHGHYGQTIGKWIMKVQVLSVDETRLSMRQAFLRDSLPILLNVVYLLYVTGPVLSGIAPGSREMQQYIPKIVSQVAVIVLLIEILTMLTNPKRRSLHDYIAGSVVVRRARASGT